VRSSRPNAPDTVVYSIYFAILTATNVTKAKGVVAARAGAAAGPEEGEAVVAGPVAEVAIRAEAVAAEANGTRGAAHRWQENSPADFQGNGWTLL